MIYTDIRALKAARPGDMIFFRAKPTNPLSFIIESLTRGPSHNAVVESIDKGGVRLFESTIRDGVNGCQLTWAVDRLAEYGDGCAWLATLDNTARQKFRENMFAAFIQSAIGRPYDKFGLLEVLGHDITHLPLKEDREMFCSAAGAAALEAAGVIPDVVPYAEVSPQWLVESAIYSELYQIIGKKRELRNFNSRVR